MFKTTWELVEHLANPYDIVGTFLLMLDLS